jgi:hypothetical protein
MVFFKVVSIELYALGPTCLPVLEDVLEPIDIVFRTASALFRTAVEESKRNVGIHRV